MRLYRKATTYVEKLAQGLFGEDMHHRGRLVSAVGWPETLP